MSKKIVSATFLLLGSVWFSACGSDRAPAAPVAPPAPQPGIANTWTQSTESIRCEALANTHCQGFFGFTVLPNGNYRVGPTSDGIQVTGSLTPAEAALMTSDNNAVVIGGAENGVATCNAFSSIPGSFDQVQQTFADTTTTFIYDRSGAQICYRGGVENAQKLQFDLNQLLQKYYPVPFPTPSPTPTVTVTPAMYVQNGHWGTQGAMLEVNSDGGTLLFDCSKGSLDEPLQLDASDNFDVNGSVIQTSGPISPGHPHLQEPAEFFGHVDGNTLHMTIHYQDDLGMAQTSDFTLTYGNAGHLDACPL